ncbi:CPBP family intramembrane glutamic endopeptidase [Thermoactinomyces sp. CICC 10735]|uniref:CPBP family intramembrane glutamic endopeptidase n=1 Tax=Thermoactinomyces sp. CICC 10735 TaxID=2767430 RepID=UPI0018DB5DA9|nr:type II CAAX endopeptidase family protein [Thermoactinomyces sp. CICC 10735]MBH8582510.1 CPBP family intramembrane metalloprotease [Thermoactinomyces sp. CICC 10735]
MNFQTFTLLKLAATGERKIHPVLAPVIAFSFLFFGGLGIFFLILFPPPVSPLMQSVWFHLELIVSFSGTALFTFAWVRLVEKRPVSSIGFTKERAFKKYITGWMWGFLLISSPVFLLWITGSLTFEITKIHLPALLILLLSMITFIIQGATEEIVVRGWLFPVMAMRAPFWIAVGTSFLFFAAMHLLNDGINVISFLNISLFGLFAVGHVLNEGSLWGICAIHSVWNWAQGSVYGLAVSGQSLSFPLLHATTHGPEWFHGGPFGIEGSILTSVILGAASWVVWRKVFIRLRQQNISNL